MFQEMFPVYWNTIQLATQVHYCQHCKSATLKIYLQRLQSFSQLENVEYVTAYRLVHVKKKKKTYKN